METTNVERLLWVLTSMVRPIAKRIELADPSPELTAAAVIALRDSNPMVALARVRLTHDGQTQGLGALEPHAILVIGDVALDPCIGSIGAKLGWKTPSYAVFQFKSDQSAFTGSMRGFTYRVELDRTLESRMIERIEANSEIIMAAADAMAHGFGVASECSSYREFMERMAKGLQ